MAFYLIQVSYKDSAAKTLVGHPQAREDAIGKACTSLGGKLIPSSFHSANMTSFIIAELPDNTAAAAFALATAPKGAVSKFHTTVLMSPDEGLEAMKKAQKVDYAPPA